MNIATEHRVVDKQTQDLSYLVSYLVSIMASSSAASTHTHTTDFNFDQLTTKYHLTILAKGVKMGDAPSLTLRIMNRIHLRVKDKARYCYRTSRILYYTCMLAL